MATPWVAFIWFNFQLQALLYQPFITHGSAARQATVVLNAGVSPKNPPSGPPVCPVSKHPQLSLAPNPQLTDRRVNRAAGPGRPNLRSDALAARHEGFNQIQSSCQCSRFPA